MSVTIRKLAVADIATMQRLVTEHADGIESGLCVLDSRLPLGHATMDVVACDAQASLVLIAVGLVADEDMLLRAVEGYSWCLEYPDAVRRLYPAAEISSERPPRMVFVVNRAPDAFQRKVKQLGFSEVEVIEARYLEVDSTPAMFFDVVARLRRGVPPAPAVVPASATTTLTSMSADVPAPRPVPDVEPTAIADNVIPLNGGARATSLKLQRLLHAGGDAASPRSTAVPTPPRPIDAPRPVLAMPARAVAERATLASPVPQATEAPATAVAALTPTAADRPAITIAAQPEIDAPSSAPAVAEPSDTMVPTVVTSAIPTAAPLNVETARLSLREAAAALIGPRESAPVAAVASDAPAASRISFADIASELLAPAAAAEPRVNGSNAATRPVPIDDEARAAIEELLGSTSPTAPPVADWEPEAVAPPAAEPAAEKTPVTAPTPVQPPVWAAVKPQPAVAVEPVVNGAKAVEPKISIKPVSATPTVAPTIRLGAKPPVPPAVPAAPATSAPAAPAVAAEQKPTPDLPAEIAGLQFPHDGQLTRQWMEFLNQMAASK